MKRLICFIGALLANAFSAARLFYSQKGKNYTDDEIEDMVIGHWVRITKKMSHLERDIL